MEMDSPIIGELPVLKRLAGELLAADEPDIDVLDRIATLATEVAAHCRREQARRELLQRVTHRAQAVFPAVAEALRSRLAQSSTYELTRFEALLERVMTALAVFAPADAELRAAHRKGDYAAMAPLALEADKKKNAVNAAIADLEKQLGLGDKFKPALAGTFVLDAAAGGAAVADDLRGGMSRTGDAPGEPDITEDAAVGDGVPGAAAVRTDLTKEETDGAAVTVDADANAGAAAAEDPAARSEVTETDTVESATENPTPGIQPDAMSVGDNGNSNTETRSKRPRLRNLVRQMRLDPHTAADRQ